MSILDLWFDENTFYTTIILGVILSFFMSLIYILYINYELKKDGAEKFGIFEIILTVLILSALNWIGILILLTDRDEDDERIESIEI